MQKHRQKRRRKPSAHNALRMLVFWAPRNPDETVPYDLLDEHMEQVLSDIQTVASDTTIRVWRRDAALALRFIATDKSGMAEFVTPALLKIAQRYVRTSGEPPR